MKQRAFTLIELLIAFAISTILLGAIYFFYLAFVRSGTQTEGMLFLNQQVDNKLEAMTRDLKSAVEIVELQPKLIRFRRYKLPEGELSSIDLETRRLETVEYRIVEKEGYQVFQKQVGFEVPKELFRTTQCGEQVFTGYVLLPPPDDARKKTKLGNIGFPRFKIFDSVIQDSSDRSRIPLVKITLDLTNRKDHLYLINKTFLPVIYARLVEPDWNVE